MQSDKPMPFRRALAWAFVMTWGQRGVATLMTFILAALLGPDTFGLVALAMIYVALIQLFLEQGLAVAIIQREDLKDEHLDSAFWLNIAMSVVLSGGTIACSGLIADANDMPRLQPVMMALSALLLVRGMTVVQEAMLRRRLDFRTLAIRGNVGAVMGGVVGITAAIAGAGVWALVAQQLTAAVVMLALLWAISGWRPRLRFSLRHMRELLGFSTNVLVARLGTYLEGRIDAIVIGPFFGETAIGLLRLAERAIDSVTHVAAHPAALLSLPHLARRQRDDRASIIQAISRCISAATIVTFPVLTGLALVADDLMGVMGEEWSAGVAPLRVLCLAGAVRAITSITGPVMQAAGRPRLHALLTWAMTIALGIAFVIVAMRWQNADQAEQVMGIAAWRTAISAGIIFPLSLLLLWTVVGYPARLVCRSTLPGLGISGAVAAAGAATLLALEGQQVAAWQRLALVGGVMAGAFAVALLLVKPGMRRRMRQAIAHKTNRAPTGGDAAGAGTSQSMT